MSLQFCLLPETPSQAVTPAQRRWNLVSVQVDIGSVDSLEEYLHRPGVVLYCREVLIPLRDIILMLDQHVTLSEAPMASPSWVRHRTAMFILLLSRVQDYVEPLRGAAPGSRVPTPSYAALDFIGKVILRYGLEGDHVPGVRLAADATLRSVIGHVSDVAWGIRRIYSRNLKSFFVMDSSLVEYRPVDALAAPSEQLMRVIIERARVNPLASSYVNSPDGLGRFFQDFYRPLATALNNAFPGSAAFPTDVPVATREAMIPFVGKLFEWSIIAYQICTQIAAYAQTPLSCSFGNHLFAPIDPEVPSSLRMSELWTFLVSEKNAPAIGEIELLEERIMEFNREVYSSLKFCRDASRLLLTNMIILGTTKVYQAPTPFDLSQYYVPPTATISFAIAEYLVIWGGFLHDENEPNRASVFDAVSRVQEIMIRRPGYLSAPIDVPGFGGTVIPSVVGVGFDTKEAQLHGLSERGRRRNFGDGISRYPLEEGEVPYFIPAIKPEFRLDLSSASPPSR
ncbi:hypothetical protein C8F01DRAFT_1090468 [Mycena amicta]|nr:hypothetical protein C8F01DRAFT_1090468 [Mycena amicta]